MLTYKTNHLRMWSMNRTECVNWNNNFYVDNININKFIEIMSKFKEQLEESLTFLKLKKEGEGFITIGKLHPNKKTGNPQHPGHVGRVIHFGLLMESQPDLQPLFLSEVISQKWVFVIQRLHKDFKVQEQIILSIVEQMKKMGRKRVTEKEFQELGYSED